MSFLAPLLFIFYTSLAFQAGVLSVPIYSDYELSDSSEYTDYWHATEEFGSRLYDPSAMECSVIDTENGLLGRNALTDKTMLWTRGMTVYYSHDLNQSAPSFYSNFQKCLEILNEILPRPCGGFIDGYSRNLPPSYYLKIVLSDKCHSPIGKQLIPPDMWGIKIQYMELTVACASDLDSMLHQFLHALGLAHEHNSQDRDTYINLRLDHAKNATLLEKVFIPEYYTYSIPYNPNSFMHMHNQGRDESIDGEPLYTLTYQGMYNDYHYNDPYKFEYTDAAGGLRHKIQATDVYKIRNMYGCNAKQIQEWEDRNDFLCKEYGIHCKL